MPLSYLLLLYVYLIHWISSFLFLNTWFDFSFLNLKRIFDGYQTAYPIPWLMGVTQPADPCNYAIVVFTNTLWKLKLLVSIEITGLKNVD